MHAITATCPVQPGQAVQRAASIERSALNHLACIRVTGTLREPARIAPVFTTPTTYALHLHLAQARGLPFAARLELGTDRASADAALPHLVTGALISVAGNALQLMTDHGHAELLIVGAHSLVVPLDRITPTPTTHTTTQEG